MRYGLLAAIAVVSVMMSSHVTSPATAAGEYLLPNLVALPAHDIHIQGTELRFATTSWNNGAIALELHGDGGKQPVYQDVLTKSGTWEEVIVGTIDFDDEHNHLHIQQYASYQLLTADGSAPVTPPGDKTTFCIIDTDRVDHKLPGAPKRPVFNQCGLDQGMSIGWGDTYGSQLAGQSLDIQNLATGDYVLRITINPMRKIKEMTDADNVSEETIHIDKEAGTVTIVGDADGNSGGPGQGRGRPPR